MNWDDYAADWDSGEAQRAYAAAAFDSLLAAAQRHGVSLNGARICDFGCGTGLLTERLVSAAARIDAVDTSDGMLDVLRAKGAERGWTNVSPALQVPDSASYDLVVCSSVCAFVPDYPGTVKALASTLRPGGLFVQWDWELNPADDEPYGLTREAIGEALTGAGLAVRMVGVGFSIPFESVEMKPLMGVGQKPGA